MYTQISDSKNVTNLKSQSRERWDKERTKRNEIPHKCELYVAKRIKMCVIFMSFFLLALQQPKREKRENKESKFGHAKHNNAAAVAQEKSISRLINIGSESEDF